MRNRLYQGVLACAAAFIFVLFSGCATTGPSKFYTLSSAIIQQEHKDNQNISVEVGPVEVPDYLDRPHLVTRSGRNELMISDFHKWAGSLQDDISRVLVESLSAALSTENVYMYPWPQSSSLTYHVKIKINRFEGTPGEQVVLNVYWAIYGKDETTLLMQQASHFYEETGDRSYAAVVAAMSRAVGKLSNEIAVTIRSLSHL